MFFMGYYINLSGISPDEYIGKLKSGYLPPIRKMLLTNIEQQFMLIKNQGISTVEELRLMLKNKKKVLEFLQGKHWFKRYENLYPGSQRNFQRY